MNTEITDKDVGGGMGGAEPSCTGGQFSHPDSGRRGRDVRAPMRGWVFYDGECPICIAGARWGARLLAARGFRLAALQTDWVREKLGLPEEALLREIKLLLVNGETLGGADALVEIARHIWWGSPLVWVAGIPGGIRLLRAAYGWLARNRYCFGGVCAARTGKPALRPPAMRRCCETGETLQVPHKRPISAVRWGLVPPQCVQPRLESPGNSRLSLWDKLKKKNQPNNRLYDWIPLCVLAVGAMGVKSFIPNWVFMWVMAFAIFFGCKWITFRRAIRAGAVPGLACSAGYLFAWPGMDAEAFFGGDESVSANSRTRTRTILEKQSLFHRGESALAMASVRMIVGALTVYVAAGHSIHMPALVTGWIAMVGLILFLHFGVFALLASMWQSLGVDSKPVMRAPLRSRSLAEFWSARWNTAFNTLAHALAFRPLARRWGVTAAMVAVFLISGLVHETVISLPARGGYGLPTGYFLLQSCGVLIERSVMGRRIGLGRGFGGWLFTLAFTAIPAYWLFHPKFVFNVILPMLNAIGAK